MTNEKTALGQSFRTTCWDLVAAASLRTPNKDNEALTALCERYWLPVYAFIRRSGRSPHDAQDLTQEFFANFVAKNKAEKADENRGRFRSFLLSAVSNFLHDAHRAESAEKRGGRYHIQSLDQKVAEEAYQLESRTSEDPMVIYDRSWAIGVLERVMDRVTSETTQNMPERLFLDLKNFLWGELPGGNLREIADRHQASHGSIRVAAHRLRKRFQMLIREEIRETVTKDEEVDQEVRYLMSILGA